MGSHPSRAGVSILYVLLIALLVGSPIVHRVTGYDYAAIEELAYELNTLGDLYDLIFLSPVGLLGLALFWRGNAWGPVLMAGVAANTVYNYAMIVTGLQNLWVFAWVAKLAVAGTTIVLLWPFLPAAGRGDRPVARYAVALYLAIVGVALSMQMGQRLVASATGVVVQMNGETTGQVDWANPVVRDPVVFFSLALPVNVAAVLGLVRRAGWGWKSATVLSIFVPNIVSLILFTGPLKEQLLKGSVSASMWGMSAMLVAVAIPAILSLRWLVRPAEPMLRPAGKVG